MKRQLIVLLILINTIHAANGVLNVFTGDTNTEIYIDGELAGKEQILKKPLADGTHYVQVKKNGQVLKSQSVAIAQNKTETLVMDDFTEYKTNVASRGAIDVEAMRVRETRGNMAFGMHGGSPASGLSLKWWPTERIGLQAIGWINNFNGNIDSRGGCRLLFNFNESVYQGSTVTVYGAIGTGRSQLRNRIDEYNNETYDLTEGALGLEFKIADFFSDNSHEYKQVVVDKDTDPWVMLTTQLVMGLGEGFLKMAHFNLEIGIERVVTRYYVGDADEPATTRVSGKVSGGFHVYF